MKFKQFKIGDQFTFPNKNRVYTKVKGGNKTCCTPKHNATYEDGKKSKFIKPDSELVLYAPETEVGDGHDSDR